MYQKRYKIKNNIITSVIWQIKLIKEVINNRYERKLKMNHIISKNKS